MKYYFTLFSLFIFFTLLNSQTPEFTRQDTLRGSITPEREWWDLVYYHLDINVNPAEHTLSGSNKILYKVLTSNNLMQIDLQPPLKISKITQNNKNINFEREGNVYWISLSEKQNPGELKEIKIFYEGKPTVAKRPPWDGGVTWNKDSLGNDFIATSCQGDGASLWWPCKDHMYDEPDSMKISLTYPNHLMGVANGRLVKLEKNKDNTNTAHWFVSSPISNYCVNMNIGNYEHFGEVYQGEKGPLDCDYYVLKQNLEKAKVHFKDATRMLEAFEHWFGPYPFYEDSFKLVEVPYLGMEHQSSVTYGNDYKYGVKGRDISGSGWGEKFDFIIIHESGHEWFANNITYKDIADMWVHESFTAYSENIFVDYFYGKEASADYLIGTRKNIRNDKPVIGIHNVNYTGSGDMYPKGANMLHNIRQLIDDDEKWRNILRDMNKDFYHQTVTGKQIEKYLIEKTGLDLQPVFNQYLRDVRVPVIKFEKDDNTLKYKWTNCIDNFNMPLKIYINGNEKWINPTNKFKSLELDTNNFDVKVDRNFYVFTEDQYQEYLLKRKKKNKK